MLDKNRLFRALGYAGKKDTRSFGPLEYPVPEVQAFHDSKAQIRVCTAPARTSKSYSAAWELIAAICDFDAPPIKHLIVGPDYDKASKEFGYVVDALVNNRQRFAEAFGVALPEPSEYRFNIAQGNMVLKWPWGAELHGKSAARLTALLGDQWGTCVLSETAEMDSTTFRRGLRTRCERFIMPTTPGIKGMWIKDMVDEAHNRGDRNIASFSYPPQANPEYNMDRFRQALKEHGPDDPFFREQFLGEWVFYGGRVFPAFQPDPVEDVSPYLTDHGIAGGEGHHCVQPFEIPRHWTRIAGVDFGWNDAFVHLWGAVSPSGDVIIYDEYYERQRSSRAHMEAIQEQSFQNKTPEVVDRLREPASQSKQIAEDLILEYDFFTRPATTDRHARRLLMQDYIDKRGDNGLPRLRVFSDNCPNLVRELIGLHYDEEKIHREGQSEHYKGDDHAIDAMGYLLSARPVLETKTKTLRSQFQLDYLKERTKRYNRAKRQHGRVRNYQGYRT